MVEDLPIQTAGSIITLKIILAAMLKTHPNPEELLVAIDDIAQTSGARNPQLYGPIRKQVDDGIEELTSHLRKSIQERNEH